jgi:hypothetical protein
MTPHALSDGGVPYVAPPTFYDMAVSVTQGGRHTFYENFIGEGRGAAGAWRGRGVARGYGDCRDSAASGRALP